MKFWIVLERPRERLIFDSETFRHALVWEKMFQVDSVPHLGDEVDAKSPFVSRTEDREAQVTASPTLPMVVLSPLREF